MAFLDLWTIVRRDFPDEKIAIFSIYLKFLDIIAAALLKVHGIEALRYDGTMNAHRRVMSQTAFHEASPDIPLLITTGAGGVGLNITDASIVIQTEPWWNHNTERQAYARVFRQGQQKKVKIYRMMASNSSIDIVVLGVQRAKTSINERLMGPLVRSWDQSAIIPLISNTMGVEVDNQ